MNAIVKLRHPEKRNRPDNPPLRKPPWIRVKAPMSKGYRETREIVRRYETQLEGETQAIFDQACERLGESALTIGSSGSE